MKKKLTLIFSALMIVAVAFGAIGTSVASAHGGGPGDRDGRLSDEAIAAVADLLGMSADELTVAIKEDGKTLQELADEAGVDMQDVKDVLAEFKDERTRDYNFYEGESLTVIAETLGMTEAEVTAAIEAGSTLQDLADDAGVDIDDLKAALSGLKDDAMRERIQTALDEGNLTEDEANWLTEGIDKGFFSKLMNFFGKRGGRH